MIIRDYLMSSEPATVGGFKPMMILTDIEYSQIKTQLEKAIDYVHHGDDQLERVLNILNHAKGRKLDNVAF